MIKLLIYKILQLFIIMVIGFIVAKLGIVNNKECGILSKISLYLLMPSAILNAFNFKRTDEILRGLLFAVVAAVIIHLFFLIFDRVYIKLFGNNPVERASIMYSNAGNLIIPIVTFILGEEWVVYSTAYLSVQILFLWTHGIRIFSSETKFSIKKILCNINIIAIMLGIIILIFDLKLPAFISEITVSFGNMLGPIGMLITGILASKINFKKALKRKRLYFISIIRIIIYPIISLIIIKLLSYAAIKNCEQILLISFLASITPSASTVIQFAQIKGMHAELAVEINILTTVFCVLTIPILVSIYGYLV